MSTGSVDLGATTGSGGGGGGGVTSLNALTGALTLVGGTGISIVSGGSTITISSSGSGGGITSINGDTTPAQTLVTASTGTDFTISTTSGVTTFAIPSASSTARGLVTTIAQTFAGAKTFLGNITAGNLSGTNSGDVTIGTSNGLSLSTQVLSLGISSSTTTGALTNTDWNTFNSKQTALTLGNLTDVGTDGIVITGGSGAVVGTGTTIAQSKASATQNGYLASVDWSTFNSKQTALTLGNLTNTGADGITITNGTGAVIGTGTSLFQQVATSTQNGYLASADWTTFNNKQTAGNYITSLTGPITATGPGAAATTISANVVTNTNLAQMPADTIKGNNTAGTANAADLTGSQVTALLTPFVGDSGSGGAQGLVPAPAAGTRQYGDFLSANGTWSYVDQSKPFYDPFQFVGLTQYTGGTSSKFENIATYVGIDGHKQYAAIVAGGGTGTLYIWDITDPAIPVLCSSILLSGAYNVSIAQISGAIYAFVPSSGGSSLYTINITNPFSLTTTSSLLITGSPGSLYSCVYSNGYVYIATQNKGLTVVDVGGGLAGGTITTPVQSYQEGGTTNRSGGVAVSGNYVYTTNYQTTFPATIRYLKTWELAAGGGTLAVPFLANTYTISGGPTGTSTKPLGVSISPSGTTAYVTDGNQNIIDIIDVTTPTSPNYLTYITPTYTLADNTLEVAVVSATLTGNYLYIPSGSNVTNGGAVDLFDVTTPSAPIKVNTIYTSSPNDAFGGIALNSGYIFGADYGFSGGYSGIAVFTQAFLNPTFGLPITSNIQVQQLTPNTALISNSSNQLASSTTTATELSYIHGVTSAIQTQLNNRQQTYIYTLTGTDISNTYITLPVTPTVAANTLVTVIGGPMQSYGADYTVTGNQLNWGSLGLQSLLNTGDMLVIEFN